MPAKYSRTLNAVCQQCGKPFYANPANLQRGWQKCCSMACRAIYYHRPLSERFWDHVDKHGPEVRDLGPCWLWTAACYPNGYGQVGENERMLLSHRVSYELHFGPIPEGLQVLHRCDVRNCVNPEHLFVGTQVENMRDMHDKGRHSTVDRTGPDVPRGEKCGWAKLTDEQVREIRRAYAAREALQHELAARFGVAQTLVSQIVRGKVWKHLL